MSICGLWAGKASAVSERRVSFTNDDSQSIINNSMLIVIILLVVIIVELGWIRQGRK